MLRSSWLPSLKVESPYNLKFHYALHLQTFEFVRIYFTNYQRSSAYMENYQHKINSKLLKYWKPVKYHLFSYYIATDQRKFRLNTIGRNLEKVSVILLFGIFLKICSNNKNKKWKKNICLCSIYQW